jgi:predicted nucleotidyltransferase
MPLDERIPAGYDSIVISFDICLLCPTTCLEASHHMTSEQSTPRLTELLVTELLKELNEEMAANPALSAAGLFGSADGGTIWAHSDIDLFVVTREEQERWEGTYLRRRGVVVHLQTLSLATLRKETATNGGGPFFDALASVRIWFDRTGDLTRGVATARDFSGPAIERRAQREFAPAIEHLHFAEKRTVQGAVDDASDHLLAGLAGFARARLALGGVYPPRDVWLLAETHGLPEHAQAASVRSGGELMPLITELWTCWRPLLSQYCSPLLRLIAAEGPVSLTDLVQRGQSPNERLLIELAREGLISETTRPHAGISMDELCYTGPSGCRR